MLVSKIQKITLALLLLGAVLFGVILAKFPGDTIKFCTAVSGWVLFVFRILYEKWDRFYLFVQTMKYRIFGLDTIWNLSVNYEIRPGEYLQKISDAMINSDLFKELKIYRPIDSVIECRSEGIMVQLVYDTDSISVHVFDIPVTYNKGNSIIRKQITPLFEEIEKIIRPESKSYFLSVKFPDKNPFYGLYMSKIAARDLVKFDITFMLEENRVEIHKDKIILQTNSLPELIQASRDVLAIAPQ